MSKINIEDSINGDGNKRKDPYANVKEVGAFKTSTHSGEVGVIDVGDRAKNYIIDLNDINALTVLGKMSKNNSDLADIAKMGQDGKRFQNKEIGLIDNETGEVDAELAELIRVAATGESEMIQLMGGGSDKGTTYIEIAIGGRWSTDVLRFEGDQLNDVLADLSDLPAICDILPNMLDLKNGASQIAMYNFDDLQANGKTPTFFHGDDAQVDSVAVKAILGGSRIDVDEAAELTQYALSAEGQADDGIRVDFTGEGVVLEIDTRNDGTTDTMIFKGDAFLEELNTTYFNGKPIVDVKNNVDQIGVFDFDEANKYFHGSSADVDSAAAKAILGGSTMNADDASALIDLALSGLDENVRYLGGDDDSAIVAVDASRDTTDIFVITGSEVDFIFG